jgi:hypothetical protein
MADDMMGADSDEGADSITIPRSVLGDRKCKPGEKLTFTVTDVDPDSGEVEATLGGYADKGGNGGPSMDEEMDAYPMET